MKSRGMVQIYTGNGKGKTTAALGVALRAAGMGKKTLFLQFMKATFSYREYQSLKLLAEWITVERFGTDQFVIEKRQPTTGERAAIGAGLTRCREAFEKDEHDIVILDEACVCVHFGSLEADAVAELIQSKPAHIELILTGRYCPPVWYDLADLVTDMTEVKHYYAKGILSRPGIDS